MKLAGECWRETKYNYGISGLKTYIYRIRQCVQHSLDTIDALWEICAELSGIKSLYTQGKIVDLTFQSNYYCLLCINNCNNESRKIKQLSEKWFELCKEAKVTGSTLHRAIGLGTLKEAQANFESVNNGVENEFNASKSTY